MWIQERVGTLDLGDVIKVQANHDFANGPQVLQTTTQLSNGLTLELNPAANFTMAMKSVSKRFNIKETLVPRVLMMTLLSPQPLSLR